MSPKDHERDEDVSGEDWNFPFEAELHALVPGLHDAQNAWLSQIDSLRAPDRKTHELIRMVCTVVRRNQPGVARHAMLAAEVGATWEEVAGSILLTEPAFGILNVVEALPFARRGWERGRRMAPARAAEGVSQATPPVGPPPAKPAKAAKQAKAPKSPRPAQATGGRRAAEKKK